MATIEKHVTRDVVVVDGDTRCSEAARIMAQRKIGSVAVREAGRITGLVTERDLVVRVLAQLAAGDLPVRRAMRTDVPSVSPTSSEAACVALMRDHTTRHLLVADAGEVVGIVSMRDLIQLMLDEKEWLIDQLETFIDGHGRPRGAEASAAAL